MDSQVAVVTGGAQGLGAAISEALLKKGYRVCISDIQEKKGKNFVNERQKIYGSDKVKFIVCNVSREDDYKEMLDFAVKEFKKIDVIVNNAGIALEQNPRKTLEVNLLGPIIGCSLAFKYMGITNGGKGGIVVNIASIAGLFGYPDAPVYTASKHGVVGLTKSYSNPYYLDRDGIIFTALCPSVTDTDLNNHKENLLSPGAMTDMPESMPPEYVAEGVLKLLEDRINGSILIVQKKNGFTYDHDRYLIESGELR